MRLCVWNSSGVTKRSMAACFRVGCRYWPMVRKSTSSGAEIVHHRQHFVARLAEPDHDAGLGEKPRVERLGAREQIERVAIVGAGADTPVERRHGLDIVVEHVRCRLRHTIRPRPPCAKSQGSTLRCWSSGMPAGWREWSRRNGRHRRRRDRRDRPRSPPHGRGRARRPPEPTRNGSVSSSAPGLPVRTLQKAHARVQVSPMIMKVAWRLPQHSPIFGQAASSHTVTRRCARRISRVASKSCAPGALTRIQGGFGRTGVSGSRAFSGWRGRADTSA